MSDDPTDFGLYGNNVAPRSQGPLPSGIRFGLRGTLDADDMARRALGSIEQAPIIEYPEDMPRPLVFTRKIAFESLKSDTLKVTVRVGKVYLKGVSLTITASAGAGHSISGTGDWVVTLDSVGGTKWCWIETNFDTTYCYLKTGAADPGNGTDTKENIRLFSATVVSSAITEVYECQHGDIHLAGNV